MATSTTCAIITDTASDPELQSGLSGRCNLRKSEGQSERKRRRGDEQSWPPRGAGTRKMTTQLAEFPLVLCILFTPLIYLTFLSQSHHTNHYRPAQVQALQQQQQQHQRLPLAAALRGADHHNYQNYQQQQNAYASLLTNQQASHSGQPGKLSLAAGHHSSSQRHHRHQPQAATATSSQQQQYSSSSRQISSSKQQQQQQDDQQALLVCPDGWVRHSTQCYRFFHKRHSWQRAKDVCEKYGAQLALVHDYQQNNFTGQLAEAQLLSSSGLGAGAAGSSEANGQQHSHLKPSSSLSAGLASLANGGAGQPLFSSDERSYWIGFRTIDRLETNTLESAANTFVSKYIGFWDYEEPRVSQGECVRATVRHESGPSQANSYKLLGATPAAGKSHQYLNVSIFFSSRLRRN